MTVINADGGQAPTCGNGLRCVAVYLHKTKNAGLNFKILTDRGEKEVTLSFTQNKAYMVNVSFNSPSAVVQYHLDFTAKPNLAKYLEKSSIYTCGLGNNHFIIFSGP